MSEYFSDPDFDEFRSVYHVFQAWGYFEQPMLIKKQHRKFEESRSDECRMLERRKEQQAKSLDIINNLYKKFLPLKPAIDLGFCPPPLSRLGTGWWILHQAELQIKWFLTVLSLQICLITCRSWIVTFPRLTDGQKSKTYSAFNSCLQLAYAKL